MKFKTFFLSTLLLIWVTNSWTQNLYKSNSHVSFYAKALTEEVQPIKKEVQQIFSKHQTVEVIDFSGTRITSLSAFYKESIKTQLKKGEFFTITSKAVMKTIVIQQPRALTLVMPFDDAKITVDLIKADIFGNNFKVISDKNPAGEAVKLGAYYRGVVRGKESLVSLSFFPSHVEGLISISGRPAIELGKMKNSMTDNVHVIYSDDNLLQQKPFICDTREISRNEYLKQIKSIRQMSIHQQAKAGIKCVTNFWETRYNLYQFYGNTQDVCELITTLFNSFATLYANENIGMKLNGTKIWTKKDPYPVSDNSTVLTDFSVKRRNFGADLAMLLSTSGGGGIAWIYTLCQSDDLLRHSVCGSVFNAGLPLPEWSWPAMVTTHEVGHNLGSWHTHDCVWNGNNTAIDGCGPEAGYPGLGDCKIGPVPAKGGTIMSYCHLLSVGVNFQLGFGPQPGNLIRGVVNSCIPDCNNCAHSVAVSASNAIRDADNVKFKALIIPNPVNHSAVLYTTGFTNGAGIRITDITGKVLWQSLNSKSAQVNLPANILPTGIYFVTVTDGKRSEVIKLLKE